MDSDSSTLDQKVLQRIGGVRSVPGRRHIDASKSARYARDLICNQEYCTNFADLREELPQIVARNRSVNALEIYFSHRLHQRSAARRPL